MIGGGILFLRNSFDMIDSKVSRESSTPQETKEASKKEDISITPIGIPLIAGPGAITSVMLLSSQANTFIDKCIIHLNIVLTLLITYYILILGKKISKNIGTTGIRIIQRIMGLVLLVISIQFIINGISSLIINQFNL
jgi:multiple antibiotic resistance protein